ncbi:MAG: FliM/FliN family flagellar motor switch protein [Alphaproteobacteria bacterium]
MADEDDMDMEAAMQEQTEPPSSVPTLGDDGDEGAIYGISVDVIAVLGTSMMQISQILKLGRGAVVELDRLVGEEIELSAEKQIIAKGEVVVIEDRLGVSITKIMKSQ